MDPAHHRVVPQADERQTSRQIPHAQGVRRRRIMGTPRLPASITQQAGFDDAAVLRDLEGQGRGARRPGCRQQERMSCSISPSTAQVLWTPSAIIARPRASREGPRLEADHRRETALWNRSQLRPVTSIKRSSPNWQWRSRFIGLITIWVRRRCRTCSPSDYPTACSSRCGIIHYIDNIQFNVSEAVDVGLRGAYYDSAGVVRDMMQNHMFQMLSYLCMEVPVSFDPNAIRNEK